MAKVEWADAIKTVSGALVKEEAKGKETLTSSNKNKEGWPSYTFEVLSRTSKENKEGCLPTTQSFYLTLNLIP